MACGVDIKERDEEDNTRTIARQNQPLGRIMTAGVSPFFPGAEHERTMSKTTGNSDPCFCRFLSPRASFPQAPCPAIVVFLRTPHELLTAEQNSEPSVPRIFPTPFLPYNCHLWLSF